MALMRIVYMDSSAQLGGAERVLLDILAGVRGTHPDWSLTLCTSADGPLLLHARRLGVETIVVPVPARVSSSRDPSPRFSAMPAAVPSAIGYGLALRGALKRLGPDVIHSNGLAMHLMAAWTKPRHARLVWHLHDYVSRSSGSAMLLRRSAGRCDAIIANSQSVADDAQRILRSSVLARAVTNGVDLSVFGTHGDEADLDAMAGIPPAPAGTVRVGLVGTFARWKGHHTFLRAVAALPADNPIRAYVIGGPIYQAGGSQWSRAELEAEATRLNVRSRVAFIDFVEDPAPIFHALDVVVHASTEPEPFGLVIAEAMACGRAVIAANAGGASEILVPGVNALVHRPGDARGLAAGIAALVRDPWLRHRLGHAARNTAERRWDVARFVREICEVYDEVSAPPAAPRAERVWA
jgi:glycosyltransferase involved in cell wall biosynthesis